MDLCALFAIAVLVINPTESVYRISRQAVSWSDAFNHCQEFGGHLATLEYLENFRHQVRTNLTDFIFENGMELWVGANLKATDWKWEGETEHTFNGDKQFYENKGCFHQQFWYSGTKVNNMSPELCLKMCNWNGAVGLKKDFCLCEKDLRNISTIELGVCHFKCTGSTSDMCGGLFGVSVYQPAKRTIFWAEAEPKDDDDCVLVRRKDTESKVDLITSKCQRQTRYLCSFSNDDKCGKNNTCLRWSTHHATWEDAKTNCKAMNGQLAEVDDARMDYMRDLNRLPPGSFWLALRRRRNWQWLTGTPVSPLDFYGHERGTTSERQCAVIQNINGKVGLAARTCELKKTYLCQYDFMKRDGSNSALTPDPNSTYISPPPTGLKTTVNSPMDGKGRNDDTDNIGVRAGTNKNLDQDRNDMEPNAEPSSASEEKGLLNTCMFVVLGFVSGMVCVLILGMIVYAIYRCNQPKLNNKHSRLESHRTHPDHQSKHSVSYSSKEDSIHLTVAPPPSDVTYASVYDQGESPFRRTQRIIRMGSANSWRHAQPRKPRHDTIDSTGSDYTWRGMIGGKVEIINTELRQQNSDQSNTSTQVCELLKPEVEPVQIL